MDTNYSKISIEKYLKLVNFSPPVQRAVKYIRKNNIYATIFVLVMIFIYKPVNNSGQVCRKCMNNWSKISFKLDI